MGTQTVRTHITPCLSFDQLKSSGTEQHNTKLQRTEDPLKNAKNKTKKEKKRKVTKKENPQKNLKNPKKTKEND